MSFAQEKDYSLAKSGKRIQGVYIFIRTEPFQEYDFIATVKVSENWYSNPEVFSKIISKAKKKYPNFNGLIFSDDDFSNADLIKFRGLENSGGGFRIGDKIVCRDGNAPLYGEILSIDMYHEKGSFKYTNIYGEEVVETKKYKKFTLVDDEQFQNAVNNNKIEIDKYKYKIGEYASWPSNRKNNFGKIMALNDKKHKATIQTLTEYGQEKNEFIPYLDITIIDYDEYVKRQEILLVQITQNTFKVGEEVTWVKNIKKMKMTGTIVALDEKLHVASIQFIDENNEEKIAKVLYAKLTRNE